jgi:predicted secreted protein
MVDQSQTSDVGFASNNPFITKAPTTTTIDVQDKEDAIFVYQDLSEAELNAHIDFWNKNNTVDPSIEHKTIQVGEQIKFDAPIHLTTGYEWSTWTSQPVKNSIVKVESKFNPCDIESEEGREQTMITGLNEGTVKISRLYMRTWDQFSVQKSKAFIITVVDHGINPETDI